MRRNILYTVAVVSLFALSACGDFDELNNDPKQPIDVPANSVFLAGEKNLVDVYTTSIWTSSPFRVLAQTWTQVANINEARYQFVSNNAPTGWWNRIYTTALSNLSEAKSLYAKENLPEPIRKNKELITDVLEVYAFHLLVNTYGDIPYTEALNRTIPFPKYDDAKTVTYDLITRLDQAIAGLDVSAASFGNADQIYRGDVAKWKKFAATLKLKLALLIADTDPSTARTKVAEAVQSGVFSSNADNAAFKYIAGVVANSNPLWQDLVNSTYAIYYAPSNFFVNTLVTLNDPRLPILFTKDKSDAYSGGIPGEGGVKENLSGFSPYWLGAEMPGVLLDYTETSFLLAEAVERGFAVGSGTAESYYNQAVKASIAGFGGSEEAAATYLDQPAVKYTTATGDWRRKIGYQKWIAFANRNWDSWTEIRRLGHPDINEVNPPANAVSAFPLRFYYPPTEQNSNFAHWNEAVTKLPQSKDEVTAKLFWLK
jgi:hypothetical protein